MRSIRENGVLRSSASRHRLYTRALDFQKHPKQNRFRTHGGIGTVNEMERRVLAQKCDDLTSK